MRFCQTVPVPVPQLFVLLLLVVALRVCGYLENRQWKWEMEDLLPIEECIYIKGKQQVNYIYRRKESK